MEALYLSTLIQPGAAQNVNHDRCSFLIKLPLILACLNILMPNIALDSGRTMPVAQSVRSYETSIVAAWGPARVLQLYFG